MVPRHFWWLAETLDDARSAKGGAQINQNDRRDMLALLERAEAEGV